MKKDKGPERLFRQMDLRAPDMVLSCVYTDEGARPSLPVAEELGVCMFDSKHPDETNGRTHFLCHPE